MLDYCKLNF